MIKGPKTLYFCRTHADQLLREGIKVQSLTAIREAERQARENAALTAARAAKESRERLFIDELKGR